MSTDMRLTSLTYYPVKSMRGRDLPGARITPRGLENDRLLMVTDPHGMFHTQRNLPRLATIVPMLEGGKLSLSAPGMETLKLTLKFAGLSSTVTIWDDHAEAVDQGEAAADWLSHYLQQNLRLMRIRDEYARAVSRKYAISEQDQVGFADGYPLLLASQDSLDELNAHMETPLPMNRFRPNLVVQGCEPFAEDGWKRIRIGEVELALVKPCARCAVTTHDQITGQRTSKEPLATLAKFRNVSQKVMFGINVIPVRLGTVKVGDKVGIIA
jgi:uncharacterized protein